MILGGWYSILGFMVSCGMQFIARLADATA
jgi:hypothetical protein